MAYIKRVKYVVRDDAEVKDELIELLVNEKGLKRTKASQLVFYGSPMSLIRWSNYLKPSEIEIYLEEYVEENEEDILPDLGI